MGAVFIEEIIHWIICSTNKLPSPHVSRSPLLPHAWVSIRPRSAGITRITPNLQQCPDEKASPVHGGWGEKLPDLNAREEPLPQPRAWRHGAVTPQGCSPGTTPEPPGAAVCLRQFNSEKPKGAYARGHEGTREQALVLGEGDDAQK